MEFIQIEVQERGDRGTAAMRRLRRDGRVPGVLYGLGRRNLPLTIPGVELTRFLKTGSHLVELKMGEQTRDAILREVQHHPITDEVLHVDLQRVDKDAPIEDEVPVVFKGHAKGTTEGGLFQALLTHLSVRARPRDIPQEVVLDVTPLLVGDEILVRDVALPEGVEALDDLDDLVAHVVAMRGGEEEEGAAAGAEGEGAPAEPELIRRQAAEEED